MKTKLVSIKTDNSTKLNVDQRSRTDIFLNAVRGREKMYQ